MMRNQDLVTFKVSRIAGSSSWKGQNTTLYAEKIYINMAEYFTRFTMRKTRSVLWVNVVYRASPSEMERAIRAWLSKYWPKMR